MAIDPISAVSEAVKSVVDAVVKVFDYAIVDPDGYAKSTFENKLRIINEAARIAIAKGDGAALDVLFGELRALRQAITP